MPAIKGQCRKCSYIKPDGTQCRTFAVNASGEACLCIYHCDPAVLKAKVMTPQRELRIRIKLLTSRLNRANRVTNELAKSRLTIDLIDKITELEDKLEKLEAPPAPADVPPETTADKLASWKKSRI